MSMMWLCFTIDVWFQFQCDVPFLWDFDKICDNGISAFRLLCWIYTSSLGDRSYPTLNELLFSSALQFRIKSSPGRVMLGCLKGWGYFNSSQSFLSVINLIVIYSMEYLTEASMDLPFIRDQTSNFWWWNVILFILQYIE